MTKRTATAAPAADGMPWLRAMPFLKSDADRPVVLLTDRQREALTTIGTRVRLPARMPVYRQESAAHWIFVVTEGVVKSYRDLPSGRRTVCAFLFARDLFGLAAHGRYLNSAQTITHVTLYRLPLTELIVLLKRDSDIQFQFLMKVTHELRESQRRALIINRRDAVGRLAMFVALMEAHVEGDTGIVREVPLPMTRSDIAAYLGLSLETVSRAAAALERRQFVIFDRPHSARILDPAGLATLIAAV
jgi:CRP/FNR family transcriptional regulator